MTVNHNYYTKDLYTGDTVKDGTVPSYAGATEGETFTATAIPTYNGNTYTQTGVTPDMTITVDADIASLTGKLGGIQTLKAQGIDTIVFVTNGASSTFALSDLLAQGSTGDSYTLNHNGDTVSFTLGEVKTDINEILAQP